MKTKNRILAMAATIGLAAAWIHAVAQAPFAQQPGGAAQPKQQPAKGSTPAQRRPATAPDPAQSSSVARKRSSLYVPGGSQGGKPAFGPRTADIRDFGATTTSDCAVAIQRAYDSLIPGGFINGANNNVHGVLFIPSGVWPMSSPLMADCANIDVVGEKGATLSCKAASMLSYPVIAGQKRYVNWNGADQHFGDSPVFATDHRIDLWNGGAGPKLDSSLVTGANQRFGLRSRSPSTVAGPNVASHGIIVWGSPPCTGASDHWRDTRVFTLELAIENPRGALNIGAPINICGMGAVGGVMDKSGAQGGPWTLTADATQFVFQFNTIEGVNGSPRSFRFGDSRLRGVQRIMVSMDFSQNDPTTSPANLCVIRCSQNGKQVAVTRGQGTNQLYQTFNCGMGASGGSLTLTAQRLDTGAVGTCTINFTDNAAAVQAALDTVYGTGNTLVSAAGGGVFNYDIRGSLLPYNIQAPILDGTNLTGVGAGPSISAAAGFSAQNAVHFALNYLAPFWFFGDFFSGSDARCAHGLAVLNLYGFKISNILRYADVGTGHNESRIGGVAPNTDLLRYAAMDANTVVILNLGDIPDMTVANPTGRRKTWNGLVRFTLGFASGVANIDTFGWFELDTAHVADDFEPVASQTYQNLTFDSWAGLGGGGVYCHNLFFGTFKDCVFSNGWQGLTLMGGYDYLLENVQGSGNDSFLCAQGANIQQRGIQRLAVADTAYRFNGSLWDAQGFIMEVSNLNTGTPQVVNDGFARAADATHITLATTASPTTSTTQSGDYIINGFRAFSIKIISGTGIGQSRILSAYDGPSRQATITVPWNTIPDTTSSYQLVAGLGYSPTHQIIRIHPDGTYGYEYKLGCMTTDNEIPGQQCPLLYASRCSGTVGRAVITLNNCVTGGQNGIPAVVLDGGATVGVTTGYAECDIDIYHLQTDGPEVAVDGPGWNVRVDQTFLPLDVECIRYTGLIQTAFPLSAERYATLKTWPPPAGRFVAGTLRASIRNPAAGAVAEYRCTGSGTAPWVSTYVYRPWAYVSRAGVEYRAINASTNDQPPSANWAALGAAKPPTWKAVSTVAP